MKQTLKLRYGETNVVEMCDVPFVNIKLPYTQCIPDREVLQEHGFSDDSCQVVKGERRIDMILGTPDIRRFPLMETVKWSDSSPFNPLLGKYLLGTIYWGMK